jgi:hypothetical protein
MGTGRRGSGAYDDRAHFVTDHVHHESSHGTARDAKRCSAPADELATCYYGRPVNVAIRAMAVRPRVLVRIALTAVSLLIGGLGRSGDDP